MLQMLAKATKIQHHGSLGIKALLTIAGGLTLSIYIWASCSTAASNVAGAMVGVNLSIIISSLLISYLTKDQKYPSIIPISHAPFTLSMPVLYVLALQLNFISVGSLDLIAGIGAVAGAVDWILFSSVRTYCNKGGHIGYCVAHFFAMSAISAASLVTSHLMVSSLITTMGVEISGAEELVTVYGLGAIAAMFIAPIVALIVEKLLDLAIKPRIT